MKIRLTKLLLLFMALFLATPLRSVVILIMPAFFLILFYLLQFKVSLKLIVLIGLMMLSSIYGLITQTTNVAGVFLSWYMVGPILLILFAKPVQIPNISDLFQSFMKYLVYILYVINALGYLAYFVIFGMESEDAFGTFYGGHFNGVHGLSILNILVFFYYTSSIFAGDRTKKNILNALFFFISFIFCFYGLGLILLGFPIAMFVILSFNLKRAITISVFIIAGIFIISQTNQSNFRYLQSNIEKVREGGEGFPRKLLMFASYVGFVYEEPARSLIGVGPGGYNSRIAFLLNEESNNPFTLLFGQHMPPYHITHAFVYWNEKVASYEAYTDGTRNKPFSSIVSICSEYGLIFGFIFVLYLFVMMIKDLRYSKKSSLALFLFMSTGYMLVSLLSEMWLETSEFLLFSVLYILGKSAMLNRNNKIITRYEKDGGDMGPIAIC